MIIEQLNTRVCIVGAGPSGASLSIFLSRKDIPHILVDAASFPRDKICGDGLDLKAVRILNQIDANLISDALESGDINDCWGFRLIGPKGKYTTFEYKPIAGEEKMPPYLTSKRLSLDNLLVNKIDTNKTLFKQQTKVTRISKEGDVWKISANTPDGEIEICSNIIVGADGDHSIVLKHVGNRGINRNHYSGAVRQYWKGIEDLPEKKLMEVYYPKSMPWSYFWIFPLGNGEANVGFGMLSAAAAKYNYNIREIFTEIINTDPIISPRFKNAKQLDKIQGWGLPMASLRRKCSGNGWLLIGDAASLISPTTGEGIGTGMTSAYIASEFIAQAVKENCFDESVFRNYDREIFSRTEDDIKIFNLAMQISPKISGWFMNHIITMKYFQQFFQRKVGHWLHTAYHTPLSVKIKD